jgi:hypothetical protein
VKAIALVQVVGRVVSGLAITTMELFTLGNVVCAAFTYLARWNKPNGVRTPILLEGLAPDHILHADVTHLEDCLDGTSLEIFLASLLIALSFGSLHLVGW